MELTVRDTTVRVSQTMVDALNTYASAPGGFLPTASSVKAATCVALLNRGLLECVTNDGGNVVGHRLTFTGNDVVSRVRIIRSYEGC